MAEHFLNGVDIRAVFQQMRREGMAQRVRCNRLFDAGLGLIVLDELPEALTRHPFPADVDEQRLFIRRCDHLRADEVDVLRERTDSRRIHGDHA